MTWRSSWSWRSRWGFPYSSWPSTLVRINKIIVFSSSYDLNLPFPTIPNPGNIRKRWCFLHLIHDSWFTILCLVLNINDSIFNVEFLIFVIQYLMLSFWYSLFNIQHSSLSRTNSSQPADPRWDKTWHFFICLLKSMYSQSLFMCWWLFPLIYLIICFLKINVIFCFF